MRFRDLEFFLNKPVAVQCDFNVAGVMPQSVNGKIAVQTLDVEIEKEGEEEPEKSQMKFGVPVLARVPVPGPDGQASFQNLFYAVLTGTLHEIPKCPNMVCVTIENNDGSFTQHCIRMDRIVGIALLPDPVTESPKQSAPEIVAPDGSKPH